MLAFSTKTTDVELYPLLSLSKQTITKLLVSFQIFLFFPARSKILVNFNAPATTGFVAEDHLLKKNQVKKKFLQCLVSYHYFFSDLLKFKIIKENTCQAWMRTNSLLTHHTDEGDSLKRI